MLMDKKDFHVPFMLLKIVSDRGNRAYSSGLGGVFLSGSANMSRPADGSLLRTSLLTVLGILWGGGCIKRHSILSGLKIG